MLRELLKEALQLVEDYQKIKVQSDELKKIKKRFPTLYTDLKEYLAMKEVIREHIHIHYKDGHYSGMTTEYKKIGEEIVKAYDGERVASELETLGEMNWFQDGVMSEDNYCY